MLGLMSDPEVQRKGYLILCSGEEAGRSQQLCKLHNSGVDRVHSSDGGILAQVTQT